MEKCFLKIFSAIANGEMFSEIFFCHCLTGKCFLKCFSAFAMWTNQSGHKKNIFSRRRVLFGRSNDNSPNGFPNTFSPLLCSSTRSEGTRGAFSALVMEGFWGVHYWWWMCVCGGAALEDKGRPIRVLHCWGKVGYYRGGGMTA